MSRTPPPALDLGAELRRLDELHVYYERQLRRPAWMFAVGGIIAGAAIFAAGVEFARVML